MRTPTQNQKKLKCRATSGRNARVNSTFSGCWVTLFTRRGLSFLEWEATGNILWTKYETEDSSLALFPGIDIDNDDCKIDISWYNHLSFICINIFTSRERSISTCYSNCPNATESQTLTESVLVVQIKTLPNFLLWTNCFGEFRY